MRNHFIFCCSHLCLIRSMINYMDELESFYGKKPKMNRQHHIIDIDNDRFYFFANINDFPERIHGLTCVDSDVCSSYTLSVEVSVYIKTHTEKAAPAEEPQPGLH